MAEPSHPVTQFELEKAIDRLDLGIDRVDQKVERLAIEFSRTNQRIDKLEEKLTKRMDDGFARVLGAIDAFAGKIEAHDRSTYTYPAALDAHGKTLGEHEKRIRILESRKS